MSEPTSFMRITAAGAKNQIEGELAALATTATDGFEYIPTCAGTPTGVPTAYTGHVPMVFDTTNNILYIYDGSWIDVIAVHNPAAAAHGSAWTTFTPVVEQDTGNSVAVTVNTARYRQIGKIVFFEVGMTVTGTGNANNEIITTLPPVAPQADWYGVPMIFGSGFVEDNSAGFLYPCFGVIVSSTAYRLRSTASGIGTAFLGNNQFTAALTASDLIRFSGWYEAA